MRRLISCSHLVAINNLSPRPFIGGVLSNPATRWPDTLGRIQYLRQHPYFLPCATSGFIAFVTFIISFFGLKEVVILVYHNCFLFTRGFLQTLPSLVAARERRQLNGVASDDIITPDATTAKTSLVNHGERLNYGATDATEHHQSSSSSSNSDYESSRHESHASSFLTRELVYIYLNYAALSFLDMGHYVLLPLFYSTSITLGGLGLDPFTIGITFGTSGFINAVIQAKLLGPLIRKYGARKIYIVTVPSLFVCFTLYPILRFLVQLSGRVDGFVIACMMIQIGFYMCIYCTYGTNYFLFLRCNSSIHLTRYHFQTGSIQVIMAQQVVDSGRMGTALGIGQMLTSGMRSISPFLVSSLFSISLQRHLAGGNLVFYILMGTTLLYIRISHMVPHPPASVKNKKEQRSASA